MDSRDFGDYVLRQKKERFLDAVRRAAELLGVAAPEVVFPEIPCPAEREDSLAHIHLDTRTICVSRRQLMMMDYEDIYDVATHEVTHILDPTHEPGFYQKQDVIKGAGWRPPSGVSYVKGSSEITLNKPKKKRGKTDRRHCNYHLCRKPGKLVKCQYCNDYFCSEHIAPTRPGMMNFNSNRPEDVEVRSRNDGHPCPPYVEVAIKEEQAKSERYSKALDVLCTRDSYPLELEIAHGDRPDDYRHASDDVTKPESSGWMARVLRWVDEHLLNKGEG